MPPRYAYWTILIDGKPTAFRAREIEELQPTLFQLKRKNADVVMKWFARGRLWDNPEQAQWAAKSVEASREKRNRDWRPGGQHKDPRARFDKRKTKDAGQAPRGFRPADSRQSAKPDARPLPKPGARPQKPDARPLAKPDARPLPTKPLWRSKPQTRSTNQRPWSGKPPREGQRPWHAKPPDRKKWPRREPPAPPKRDDNEK